MYLSNRSILGFFLFQFDKDYYCILPGDGIAADGAEGGRAVAVPGGEGEDGVPHLALPHLPAVLLLLPRRHVLVHVLHAHLHGGAETGHAEG